MGLPPKGDGVDGIRAAMVQHNVYHFGMCFFQSHAEWNLRDSLCAPARAKARGSPVPYDVHSGNDAAVTSVGEGYVDLYMVTKTEKLVVVQRFCDILSTYKEAEDLINIGAYVRGSNPRIDYSLSKIEMVRTFLRQGINEKVRVEDNMKQLYEIIGETVA